MGEFLVGRFPAAPKELDEPFWAAVRVADSVALVLDYDGVLAPIRKQRMVARPSPGTVGLLSVIARCNHLAVVSGRPLAELVELLGELEIWMAGVHGLQWRVPDGRTHQISLPLARDNRLEQAYIEAHLETNPWRIVRKPDAVAVHTRDLPPAAAEEREAAILARWESEIEDVGLHVGRFDGGVEIRSSEPHKGTAVDLLLQTWGNDVVPIYVGDDVTDEDAFAAVSEKGYGIRVGLDERETQATYSLSDCAAVPGFLRRWVRDVSGEATR